MAGRRGGEGAVRRGAPLEPPQQPWGTGGGGVRGAAGAGNSEPSAGLPKAALGLQDLTGEMAAGQAGPPPTASQSTALPCAGLGPGTRRWGGGQSWVPPSSAPCRQRTKSTLALNAGMGNTLHTSAPPPKCHSRGLRAAPAWPFRLHRAPYLPMQRRLWRELQHYAPDPLRSSWSRTGAAGAVGGSTGGGLLARPSAGIPL